MTTELVTGRDWIGLVRAAAATSTTCSGWRRLTTCRCSRSARPVGAASTVKMLRSVMVKGLEALFAETVLAARRAAVDAEVLASLQASFPGFVWEEQAAYNLERMLTHGARRAAEMEDAAATLQDLGVEPLISAGTAEWQRKLGAFDAGGLPQGNYRALADRIIRCLRG